jgi:hypothetical protein
MTIRATLTKPGSSVTIKVESAGCFIPGQLQLRLALNYLGWSDWRMDSYEEDTPIMERKDG